MLTLRAALAQHAQQRPHDRLSDGTTHDWTAATLLAALEAEGAAELNGACLSDATGISMLDATMQPKFPYWLTWVAYRPQPMAAASPPAKRSSGFLFDMSPAARVFMFVSGAIGFTFSLLVLIALNNAGTPR